VLSQLPAEVLQVHAVLHTGQIEEHLVNRILFHPGASSSRQLITRADMDA
jgi:hypothetical protein